MFHRQVLQIEGFSNNMSNHSSLCGSTSDVSDAESAFSMKDLSNRESDFDVNETSTKKLKKIQLPKL